jgi:thiol-disulfide isomerase/thioredoxin
MNWKRIIRNFLLVVAGIVALLITLEVVGKYNASLFASPEIRELAERKLVSADAATFAAVIRENLGKPQIFFIYASWCPYCKHQFGIINRFNGYGKDKLAIHYISIDEDIYALAEFLRQTYPALPFTPYYAASGNREDFFKALRDMGFTPKGSIPFIVLLDKEGKPAKQFSGFTEMQYLLENVEKLL